MKHPLPDAALDGRLCIVGISGSGKSTTAKGGVERLLDQGRRVCIVDLLDGWWGLRLRRDGKSPAFPVAIFGGLHGDLPLNEHAGALIGQAVAQSEGSSIVSLAELDGDAPRRRFALAFFDALHKANRAPLHLVVDEADFYCVPPDTDVLTPDGWLPIAEATPGVEISCFDISTGKYSFAPIERSIQRTFSGHMVHIKTKSLDCLVTPEHRVVLRRYQRAKGRSVRKYPWTFCEAAAVPTCVGIPIGGAPCGAGIPNLSIETCRILGWIITDGSIHDRTATNWALSIEQSLATTKRGRSVARDMAAIFAGLPGVRKYDRPERNSNTMGRSVKGAAQYSWYLPHRVARKFLALLGDDIHRVPRHIIANASEAQLQALYQGLLEGHGTTLNGRWCRFYGQEGLIDDFQEIATRLGVSTFKKWVVSLQQWHLHIATLRKEHWIRRRQAKPYEGPVYCVTVPTSAFVARRNGTVFVTGNCPQQPVKDGPGPMLLNRVKEIAARGRMRGFRLWSVTQRPAKLHKDVMSQADTLVAMQLTSSQDRGALKAWIGDQGDESVGAGILKALPSLKRGEGVVWSPRLGVLEATHFPLPDTYDSSRTPEYGETAASVELKPIDLGALREKLGKVDAEVKANDPATLKAEVRRLTAELAKKPLSSPPIDTIAIETARQEGWLAANRLAAANMTDLLSRVIETGELIDRFKVGHEAGMPEYAEVYRTRSPGITHRPTAYTPAPSTRSPVSTSPAAKVSTGGGTLKPALQRVVNAIGWWRQIGQDPVDRSRACVVAGLSPKASTFGVYIGELIKLGLVESSPGKIGLTPEGAALAIVPAGDTREQIHDVARGLLGPQEQRVFDAIYAAHPKEIARVDLANAVGLSPTASTLGVYIGGIAAYGIIENGSRGHVRVAGWLFP